MKNKIKLILSTFTTPVIVTIPFVATTCSTAGYSAVTNVVFIQNGQPLPQRTVQREYGNAYMYTNIVSNISSSSWILNPYTFTITIDPTSSTVKEIAYQIKYYETIGGEDGPEGADNNANFNKDTLTFNIPQVELESSKHSTSYQRHENIYIWKSSTISQDNSSYITRLEIIYTVGGN